MYLWSDTESSSSTFNSSLFTNFERKYTFNKVEKIYVEFMIFRMNIFFVFAILYKFIDIFILNIYLDF